MPEPTCQICDEKLEIKKGEKLIEGRCPKCGAYYTWCVEDES